MGAHTSFPMLIEHLVSLKSHFHHISTEKFQGIMRELSNYDIQLYSDDDNLPNTAQLASKLQLDESNVKKTLKDLHAEIVNSFYDHPLEMRKIVHILNISPYDYNEDRHKLWDESRRQRSISMPIIFQVTPRIGDYVEIPFIRTTASSSLDDKCYYGYVHNVRHYIKGTTQEILISVYNENFYFRWEEMKKEYEDRKRFWARLKASD